MSMLHCISKWRQYPRELWVNIMGKELKMAGKWWIWKRGKWKCALYHPILKPGLSEHIGKYVVLFIATKSASYPLEDSLFYLKLEQLYGPIKLHNSTANYKQPFILHLGLHIIVSAILYEISFCF